MKKFAYDSPLEIPDEVELDPEIVEINGMPFQKRSDCVYQSDYVAWAKLIEQSKKFTALQRAANPGIDELNIPRNLMQSDLFFIVYFVLKNPLANHPFIVEACKEVQFETGDTLQAWARDHLKSTIITVAKSCLDVFNNPEERIGIFSAVRPLALAFLKLIRKVFEDPYVIRCFPDILYNDPYKEAEKWSEATDGGLIVKRKNFFKEPTISAWGLTEGMPTGYKFTKMRHDDIVVHDMQSPDVQQKVKDNFDMSVNLADRTCQTTVIGTFYNHNDALVHISELRDPITNEPLYKTIKKPATENGELNGKSVFLPERILAKKRALNLFFFFTQQLLDPTPRGAQKLDRKRLIKISAKQLPQRLYKFMMIDGAGNEGIRADARAADAWSFVLIGVDPFRGDEGASNIYILDLVIEEMDLIKAIKTSTDMYARNGRVLKLGVEKVGMSTTEIHVTKALRKKGRFLSEKKGNLVILKPGGRSKKYRIESALCWPLENSKIHYLDTIPHAQIERLMLEMDKFPYWHDDGLDGLSYGFDLIKDYNFGERPPPEKELDAWEKRFQKMKEAEARNSWITV